MIIKSTVFCKFFLQIKKELILPLLFFAFSLFLFTDTRPLKLRRKADFVLLHNYTAPRMFILTNFFIILIFLALIVIIYWITDFTILSVTTKTNKKFYQKEGVPTWQSNKIKKSLMSQKPY